MTVQEILFPDSGLGDLDRAVEAARTRLLSIQRPDGHWCGELEGDTILESEYLLLLYYLGRSHEGRFRKGAEYLRRQQLAGGGWAIYAGGPTDLSASVKAYFVLKLAGDDPSAEHMTAARNAIRAMGGIDACNSFTRIYLSIFGQYEWDKCPAVPPEPILLPDWFVFNIYSISSWSRAIVVPLSIIWALRPQCSVPPELGIAELRVEGMPNAPAAERSARGRFWRAFFHGLDLSLKGVESLPWKPFRRQAIARAAAWIEERLEMSSGLGAIFPPIINTVFAFHAMGHSASSRVISSQLDELEKLEIEEGETLRLQPCFSPVWDTALAVHALAESGLAAHDPRLLDGARWLLRKQTTTVADWKHSNPNGEPGGWFFQYENEFYPDTDDTSEVLLALDRVRFPDPAEESARKAAVQRAVQWQLSMQNRDGGWGAFDKGCDNDVLTFIPFADHNAMIDPSCEDITGRTVEAFVDLGFDPSHTAIQSAARFLRDRQDASGTWYGRWGCNYIYGTFLAIRGLKRAGEPMHGLRAGRMVRWLTERQNEDGGWGELQRSYEEPSLKGVGPSTPSQTSWALLALIAADHGQSQAARRGVEYLLRTQLEDGSWFDDYWTATGFPKVFYLRYHLYALYFPLWALAEYRRCVSPDDPVDVNQEDGVSA
jgi:squalene-hopene/tetraprenyl-beta-curcumene cyclase